MRLVIQRVFSGWVNVEDKTVAQIGLGLVILVGVGQTDTEEEVKWLAEKCAHLRIFEDREGKSNLSILDVEGEALVISQFTLYADTKKGRRPSFIKAGDPEIAEPLVKAFARAHMLVGIENDGPVTIVMERESNGG
jgi:D-tyrosyl-tRNA(Tyr) deacylase